MQALRQWFDSLEAREKRVLLGGAGVLLLILVHVLAIRPYLDAKADLTRRIEQLESEVPWMRQAAGRLESLRAGGGDGPGPLKQSLFAVVDNTAKSQNLGGAMRRMTPEGDNSVSARLEKARFDDVLRWLGTLRRQYGVRVTQVSVARADDPGMVNVSVTLAKGAA